VVACLRVIDQDPAVDPLTGEIRRDGFAARASPADLAALEHALRVAEAWSGRVLAVAMGPPAADAILREAIAVGARALRVSLGAAGAGAGDTLLEDLSRYVADLAQDSQATARTLAAAIRTVGEPSLIVCGDRSADRGTGELPARLAHEFNAAQALGLVRLEAVQDHLVAERRLDRGGRERLRVRIPAVCSVEAAGVTLRRAGMGAALDAAGATIPVVGCETSAETTAVMMGAPRARRPRARVLPPPAGGPRERLLALTGVLVDRERPTVVGPLDADAAAEQLLAYLERQGYLTDQTPGEP
jgi:electron transfer flavoprotein beta subunit